MHEPERCCPCPGVSASLFHPFVFPNPSPPPPRFSPPFVPYVGGWHTPTHTGALATPSASSPNFCCWSSPASSSCQAPCFGSSLEAAPPLRRRQRAPAQPQVLPWSPPSAPMLCILRRPSPHLPPKAPRSKPNFHRHGVSVCCFFSDVSFTPFLTSYLLFPFFCRCARVPVENKS